MAIPPITPAVLVVYVVILAAIALFVSEALPPDTTAIAVLVTLYVLRPYTEITTQQALAGFANPATLTIVAMYVLSAAIQRVGLVDVLQRRVAAAVRGDPRRLLGATVGITAPLAGVVNNTPVVAVFVPMVTELADEVHVSPSKLLLPLSYAAMLGGTLTLVGTSTNLLASELARNYVGRGFTMFEFTPLGILVVLVGAVYLFTVAQHLLPERVPPADLVVEFGVEADLARVYVRPGSPLVGRSIADAFAEGEWDLDVLQLVRGDRTVLAAGSDRAIEARDVLTVRATPEERQRFVDATDCRQLPAVRVREGDLVRPGDGTLVEAVVPDDSEFVGVTLAETGLRRRFDATVLAVRQGDTVVDAHVGDVALSAGDAVLLYAPSTSVELLRERGALVVTERGRARRANGRSGTGETGPSGSGRTASATDTSSRAAGVGDAPEDDSAVGGDDGGGAAEVDRRDAAIALGVLLGVIAVAAAGLAPIALAALGGVVIVVATGVIRPAAAYDAVSWEVVFLLAGVVPLGTAMAQTGGAAVLGAAVLAVVGGLPDPVVLAAIFLLTGLLANLITPVATVALVFPVAIDAAEGLGASPYAFALAVTFAASTAFMTPMGYQTNLMVYTPGGYRFADYVRVGAPLQLLLAVVTTVGITLIWGL